MAQWYYTNAGQQAGPVDESQLKGLVSSGQVGPQDLVWKDGMANWLPAASVSELGAIAATPASTPQPQYDQVGQAPYTAPQGPSYAAPQGQPFNYGGYAQQQSYPPDSVPNYLVQSILVTIFCCMPLGIVAIVFAAQVNGKLAMGDYAGAVDASKKAKLFSWIGFGSFFAGIVVYLIFVAIIFAGAASHG